MVPSPSGSRLPRSWTSRTSAKGSGLAVVVSHLLLVLVGTTFVGHDWNSGSMSNQLLFEPRRLRVWAAKGAGRPRRAGSRLRRW